MFPSEASLTRLVGRGRATSRRRRSPSSTRTGRSPSRRPRSAARSSGSWRSRKSRRASSLRTGWRRHRIQERFRILATTHSLCRDEPGARLRAYTSFLDATGFCCAFSGNISSLVTWSESLSTYDHEMSFFRAARGVSETLFFETSGVHTTSFCERPRSPAAVCLWP